MTDTTSPALTGQPTNYPLGRLPVEIDPRRRAPEPDEVHHDALAPAPHRCPAAVATWSGWVRVGTHDRFRRGSSPARYLGRAGDQHRHHAPDRCGSLCRI